MWLDTKMLLFMSYQLNRKSQEWYFARSALPKETIINSFTHKVLTMLGILYIVS